jgi:hypothetical protein
MTGYKQKKIDKALALKELMEAQISLIRINGQIHDLIYKMLSDTPPDRLQVMEEINKIDNTLEKVGRCNLSPVQDFIHTLYFKKYK